MAPTRTLPIDRAALQALMRRRDAPGTFRLTVHATIIGTAAAGVLAAGPGVAKWLAMGLLGTAEMALFAPLHETTHRTPFASPALNRLLGWVAGALLILPPAGFRLFHVAHHRHTQDAAMDPELIGTTPPTRRDWLWRLTGLPYWAAQIRGLVRTAAGDATAPWIPVARRAAVVREARAYLALYAGLAAASIAWRSALVVELWIGPALLGQPVLRAFLAAEHGACPRTADGFENTRTTLAPWPVRWLFWNMNYHTEHHLAPGVPFHALGRLHAMIRPQLRCVAPGYLAAHRHIWRGLA